ncbi:sigma-70 family RNA polymerase sigma factor [Glycomyces sp. NPDC048151]|uniref:sigma-70 family RNA polymerase sigma factor n=1 Tax=Glycomyces sp. NPDC048151 TaxID=3364002 RepID=UPI0037183842
MDAATVERFEAGRPRLASLAYRLLGSAADAEDVVQDAFLRWQAADRDHIRLPEAWLTKVVTNLALDRLRSAQARKERAVGAWLPEPLLEGDPMLGPAETVEQRESVSMAVLILLERLSPVERAVYILREAFAYSHNEIADILDITVAASQQHALRARRHVAAGRDAVHVDREAAHRIVEEFLAAATSGETDRLVALLTDDATAVSDGFGLMDKLRHESLPDRIAAWLRAGFKPTPAKRDLVGGAVTFHSAIVNGAPAALAVVDDRVAGLVVLDPRGGKVAGLVSMAAAHRLARVTEQWQRCGHRAPVIGHW